MPEQISKYPEVTIQVLQSAGARCVPGVEKNILTRCPSERFCALPGGDLRLRARPDPPHDPDHPGGAGPGGVSTPLPLWGRARERFASRGGRLGVRVRPGDSSRRPVPKAVEALTALLCATSRTQERTTRPASMSAWVMEGRRGSLAARPPGH